jgi:hypothetical protein
LLLSDPTLLIWAIFATWGICRTVPFLGKWGFYAIRDGAIWGYGLVMVLVVAFLNNSNQISRALNTYGKAMKWVVPTVVTILALTFTFFLVAPAPPWAGTSGFALMKSADASIHLAGAALFALLFSFKRKGQDKKEFGFLSLLEFAAWVPGVAIILLATRAGFMAIIVPLGLLSLLMFRRVGWKALTIGLCLTILSVGILETDLITITIRDRHFSADQISAGMTSIFGNTEHTELEGTKKNIVEYTVFGPYFWTGKGFGVNLAVEDGPPGMTAEETSLRSPHNGSMTVLARMGVPGALLWIALNLSFIVRMLAAFRRAKSAGLKFWTAVNIWILCFWLAQFINLSFDVYVEGPIGGMWFWATIGFGLAALRIQAFEARKARTEARFEVAV